MLAAVACGAYPDVTACARQLTAVKDVTRPEPGLTAAYEERYRRWRKLYPAMKPFYQALADSEPEK
jgi:xylulokinase